MGGNRRGDFRKTLYVIPQAKERPCACHALPNLQGDLHETLPIRRGSSGIHESSRTENGSARCPAAPCNGAGAAQD